MLKVDIRPSVSDIFKSVRLLASMGGRNTGLKIESHSGKIEDALEICAKCTLMFCPKVDDKGLALPTISAMITQSSEEIVRALAPSLCFTIEDIPK